MKQRLWRILLPAVLLPLTVVLGAVLLREKYYALVILTVLLLTVVLPAGSTFNLNPIQLMEAVSGRLGRRIYPPLTVRTALLCEDLSEFI